MDRAGKTKELTYNYVDRVRLAETSLQDYNSKCPTRGSGWRHNKSISHLDLATSCHSAASGINHWSQHHTRHQLRHSRSLDYNQIDRCKDALDIAEFYWRIDPEDCIADYDVADDDVVGDDDDLDDELIITNEHKSLGLRHHNDILQQQQPQQHYRDYNYADDNYHSTNSIYQQRSDAATTLQAPLLLATTPTTQQQLQLQAFDFGSESCSLRRSRSLAVIREETFSDLQITSANSNRRRSQLIPRARLVNHRGFIRERERLIYSNNNKHHHHHHNNSIIPATITTTREKLANGSSNTDVGAITSEQDVSTCDSHQHQHQQRHHHHHHYHHNHSSNNNSNVNDNQHQQHHHQSREADDYYDNLKRLDALALGLAEQLHPWHNDKSDLESLNSDYFKNSLHQSHEHKQQLDLEALEQAVNFLTNEKPRIYQSRRQQRTTTTTTQHSERLSATQQKLQSATAGADSYPENSQSSAFPETTTSNSDDQTDSLSLSEQEYDLKKIEKIYQKTQLDGDEESYELISLTTTRTRIETTEDEDLEEEDVSREQQESVYSHRSKEREIEFRVEFNEITADAQALQNEGTLKRSRAHSENLEKLIAYDSVYLSSEEGSESTLVDDSCETFERTTITASFDEEDDEEEAADVETATLLHFSIEDIVYEPTRAKQHKSAAEAAQEYDNEDNNAVLSSTEIVENKVTAEDCAEKEPEDKRETLVNVVESVNTKIEILEQTSSTSEIQTTTTTTITPDNTATTLYTQILKVEHTPTTAVQPILVNAAPVQPILVNATPVNSTATPKASAPPPPPPPPLATLTTTTVGVTSSVASKPKILSVVEKRKWKRYADAVNQASESVAKPRSNPQQQHSINEATHYPHPHQHLKRQATDSFYIPFKANLGGNQYHSLPDVNIGQSLKVSECIDAKLRSSYNLNKYQRPDDDELLLDCQLREGKTTTTLILENNNNKATTKQQKREEIITTEEIYDSIKRFGRAHQKARQIEYQELNEVIEKETQKKKEEVVKEKRIKLEVNEKEISTTSTEHTQATVAATAAVPPLLYTSVADAASAEIVIESEDLNTSSSASTSSCSSGATLLDDIDRSSLDTTTTNATDTLEYQEKPKEAPNIEIANFSKLIERRAKEIRENSISRQARRQQQFEAVESFTSATFRINKSTQNYTAIEPKVSIVDEPTSIEPAATSNQQFRIIVTDAQNNIIEEDSIDSNPEDSLNPCKENNDSFKPKKEIVPSKVQKSSDIDIKIALRAVKTTAKENRQEKSPATVNNNNSNSHNQNRVASLKRVPSKPKRQQQQQHQQQHQQHSKHNGICCQQQPQKQQQQNSKSNYCELSTTKSKERRVLCTQIYKARPIKVLATNSNNNSFRRKASNTTAGSKMSRPQILHVVDNKRRADIVSSNNINNNNNNSSNHSNMAKNEGDQVENEYLKKVDAVRTYWTKLAKHEQEQFRQEQEENEHENQLQTQNELPREMAMDNGGSNSNSNNVQQSQQQQHTHQQREPRQFILGTAQETHANGAATMATTTAELPTHHRPPRDQDDFCSFMPSIEIVELNGEKTATIVSAVPPNSNSADTLSNDASEPQFDHIRYKVLKSQQLIRSNIMSPRNKKEAQFDGLIQYLQEYSFQELLSNNNVVIVEPVRTKIERPLMTTAAMSSSSRSSSSTTTNAAAMKVGQGAGAISAMSSKTTTNHKKAGSSNNSETNATNSGATTASKSTAVATRATRQSNGNGGGIKRHFFYQPVRVNRELYEEELPNPDVVRNVRKFFEDHILPTPGHGIVVGHANGRQHEEEEDDETKQQQRQLTASNLPQSPRTRRARKYRYLTIDTSYGHVAQKQQQQAPISQVVGQQASRKWDTASLSSGISSGDLSSPCECNEVDGASASNAAGASNKCINNMEHELKGVHVQDVVRRHNSKSSSVKKQSEVEKLKGVGNGSGSRGRIRPRSAIYGSSRDSSSYYRDIYEYNVGHRHDRTTTEEQDNDDNEMFADDDDDAVDEDIDDELCESYYVSNDVLEKIRECGSSVTYYGGRVLQSSSPDPLCPNYNNGHYAGGGNNNNAQQHSTIMTLTRARAREIETCSVCQPNECPHKKQLQQQFQQRKDNGNNHNRDEAKQSSPTTQEETTNGIKFKLVKSNSCSSRLELAGAGEVVMAEDAAAESGDVGIEVVKKMVNHFESNKKKKLAVDAVLGGDDMLTINNQIPARIATAENSNTAAIEYDNLLQQVTVNNHINVPVAGKAETLMGKLPRNEYKNDNNKVTVEKAETDNKNASSHEKTFESSAMDIRLDTSERDKTYGNSIGSVAAINGATKICRNKNVDLAFTMAKQQQIKSGGTSSKEDIAKTPTAVTTQVLRKHDSNQSETLDIFSKEHSTATTQQQKQIQKQNTNNVTSVTKTLESNLALSTSVGDLNNRGNDNGDDVVVIDDGKVIAMTSIKSAGTTKNTLSTEIEKVNAMRRQMKMSTSSTTSMSTPTPTQIIVPVEIHRSDIVVAAPRQHQQPQTQQIQEEKSHPLPTSQCLSTTSSTASLIDKTVVRHYVANDKSLFEKRKYDDIEFEEFEIYDPTKDFEKLSESAAAAATAAAAEAEEHENTNSNNNISNRFQMADKNNRNNGDDFGKLKSSNVSDLSSSSKSSTLASKTVEKLKLESDCYDSLEERL